MATARKLNIGRLSLWIEDGRPRFAGAESLDAARGQARELMVRIEEWLAAEDKPSVKKLPLSSDQWKAVHRLMKKLKMSEELAEDTVRALWNMDL